MYVCMYVYTDTHVLITDEYMLYPYTHLFMSVLSGRGVHHSIQASATCDMLQGARVARELPSKSTSQNGNMVALQQLRP